jgi:hypothetical protein
MNPNTATRADLRGTRARLAAEIKEGEAKLARLREAIAIRRTNLSRLDAALALQGGDARGLRPHE